MPVVIELELHLLVKDDRLGFHRAVRLTHGPQSDVVEAGDGGIKTGSNLGLGSGDGIRELCGKQRELLVAGD